MTVSSALVVIVTINNRRKKMKSITFLLFTLSITASAKSGAVLCKGGRGEVLMLLGDENGSCAYELYHGEACFVGDRRTVIALLNSSEVEEQYEGTDGELVMDARPSGVDAVSFLQMDYGNETSLRVI